MAVVLIVDDSPTQAENQKRILETAGHQVIFAENGDFGIAQAKSKQPDVILMDVVMPEMNGFQATRKLTRDPATKNIPVILVTTKNQKTDRLWGQRQGAKGYVVKPVIADELLNTIDRCLS